MKLIVGLIVLVAFSTFGEIPYVGELPQFKVNHPEIIWDAPTNHVGASLWVYKVVPQTFPVKGINHLLASGGFTNRLKVSQGLSIANSSNTCNLVIVPAKGYIRYRNFFAEANHWDKTNHLHEPVRGLPKTNDVEKLGLKWLKEFGIERKDLVQRADGHLITHGERQTRGYFDRQTNRYVEDEPVTRGIFFTRRLDGVDFLGIGLRGGCEISFGNNANVSQFSLIWRNYQPYEKYKVASPEEIKRYILANETLLTKKNFVNSTDVKTLTITDVIPAFIGANELEQQDFLCPLARIEATADMGTNKVGIELYCPILSDNNIGLFHH